MAVPVGFKQKHIASLNLVTGLTLIAHGYKLVENPSHPDNCSIKDSEHGAPMVISVGCEFNITDCLDRDACLIVSARWLTMDRE